MYNKKIVGALFVQCPLETKRQGPLLFQNYICCDLSSASNISYTFLGHICTCTFEECLRLYVT